jgi:ribosomal protein S18 acetylase RimI-like enzyme
VNLSTRDYQTADWQAVSQIHDRARPIELEGSCDPRAFVPLAEDKGDLQEFRECHKLVACVEDQVVGFIGIDKQDIGWLYVDPAHSGQGIGRHLLQRGLEAIGTKANVHVLDGNKRAISLYQSEGFSIVESFKSHNNGYPCQVLKLSQ